MMCIFGVFFCAPGFCEKDTLKDVTEAARRLNPKFPGYLTSPFWALGRNICRPTGAIVRTMSDTSLLRTAFG